MCAVTMLGAAPCVLTRVCAHQLGGGTRVCACPQRGRTDVHGARPHAGAGATRAGEPVPSAALGAKARPALHTRVPPPGTPQPCRQARGRILPRRRGGDPAGAG